MNKKTIKIFIIGLIVICICSIANYVRATTEKNIIIKENKEGIEGRIELKDQPMEDLSENRVEEIYNIKNVNTFYYDQLKSDISRKVYNELKSDTTAKGSLIINFSGQTYSINVNNISNETYLKDFFNKKIYGYIYDAIVAFQKDVPEIYWYYAPKMSIRYSIDKNNKKITLKLIQIDSVIEERKNYKQFNKKIDEVVNSISGSSTYDIVKNCHDYICNSVVYTKKDNTYIDQTAYDALINNQGVCDAQSKLFTLLCRRKGIKCIALGGSAR